MPLGSCLGVARRSKCVKVGTKDVPKRDRNLSLVSLSLVSDKQENVGNGINGRCLN